MNITNAINSHQLYNEIYKFMVEMCTDAMIIDITILENRKIRYDHKSLLVIDNWNEKTGVSDLIFVSLTGFKQTRLFDNPNRSFILNEIRIFVDEYLGGKQK